MLLWTKGVFLCLCLTYCVQFCPVHLCVLAYILLYVCPSVRPETLLTRYLAEYLTHFYQTYINDALLDGDERVTVWGKKVKGQGHSGIRYAGNNIFWLC